MFSMANRFSIPMSQAIPVNELCATTMTRALSSSPKGSAGEGAKLSFRIGIRAFGKGLTTKFVS